MRNWHLAAALGVAVLAVPSPARAGDDTIKTPDDHPHYFIEVEPHGLLGFDVLGWGGFGFGAGVRLSMPFMRNGFVPKINNTPAISFGFDWLYYGSCYITGGDCSAHYFYFPVALQWNFFVAKHWSVMGEPGLAPYYGLFTDFCSTLPVGVSCRSINHFGVTPWVTLGARFHFNEHIAVTFRVGYPIASVGVSFM